MAAAQTGGKAGSGGKTGKRANKKAKPAKPASRDKTTVAKMLSHPTRVRILAAAHREEVSTAEFAKAHGLSKSTVAGHFRQLAKNGYIKLIRKEPVRGSVRKIYVGTKRGILSASGWKELPESVQSDIATAGLQDFVDVAVHAIDEGSFTNRDFTFTWDEVKLDQIGWDKLGKMLSLLWTKVPSLEEESAVRMGKTDTKAMRGVVGLAAFEAPSTIERRKKHTKRRA